MTLGSQILPSSALSGDLPEGFQVRINRCWRPREGQLAVVATASGVLRLEEWPAPPGCRLIGRVEGLDVAATAR